MKYGLIEVPDYDPVAAMRESPLLGPTMVFPSPPARTCNERTLQTMCQQALDQCGWRWFHDPDAPEHQDRRGGTVHKDGRRAGFPDLLAVRPPTIRYFELKTTRGVVSPEQRWWMEDINASGAYCHLIRPDDWLRFLWLIVPEVTAIISTGPHDYKRGEYVIQRSAGGAR